MAANGALKKVPKPHKKPRKPKRGKERLKRIGITDLIEYHPKSELKVGASLESLDLGAWSFTYRSGLNGTQWESTGYFVSSIFNPATTSTAASKRLMTTGVSLRLPNSAPSKPPIKTAATHHRISGGSVPSPRPREMSPSNPAAEFTRMNAAEIPAVFRMSAQPKSNNNGLKKMPPPTPVKPD